jgi:hypothetical protein
MYAGVLGNPYDAIPPYGEQSIMHPAKNVHCMCSDAVAQAQIDDGASNTKMASEEEIREQVQPTEQASEAVGSGGGSGGDQAHRGTEEDFDARYRKRMACLGPYGSRLDAP